MAFKSYLSFLKRNKTFSDETTLPSTDNDIYQQSREYFENIENYGPEFHFSENRVESEIPISDSDENQQVFEEIIPLSEVPFTFDKINDSSQMDFHELQAVPVEQSETKPIESDEFEPKEGSTLKRFFVDSSKPERAKNLG